jgi:PAS domain S-box-containing protein
VVDGIIVIDERGAIESFNTAAEHIFGYLAKEVLGRNVNMLMPEPFQSAHDGYLRSYLETGRQRIIGIGREVTGRRKDGSTFPMDLAVNPVFVGDKRCFTGIVRDISERKRMELELIQALEAAIAGSRAKSEFLSSMSHELRTPLNAILGFGQLLEMDQTLATEQVDNAHEIVKAGRHLLTLINEVLDLARIESGKLTLSMEPVQLVELIEECAAMVESGAIRQGLAFHRDMAHCQERWVRADRLRLKQVLINLISNAIKYNREGGSVQITCESKSNGLVRLAVTDTGPGIPEDKLAELFTPFNRLGLEAGSIEGSGIGLVISKRLVEMMGGEIGVDSQPGQGCTFWMELAETEPLTAPAVLSATGSGSCAAAGGAIPAGKPHRHTILYVEDNPANLRLMQRVLAPRSDIRLVSSGEPLVGLELAHGEHPDLIMLDINLPGMSGYEMLKELQASADTCEIPVLAISANAMPADIERGLAAGFLAYLTKPLDLARLQTEIDRLLA